MATPQLPNYLLSHRKRLALSQDDVAFLLGAESGAKVCRYERFVREPGLETALAFEIIFQTPIKELFPALYQQLQKDVSRRAKICATRPAQGKPGWRTARKRQTFADIAALAGQKASNHS